MKVILVSGIPVFPAHEGNRSRILALSRAIRAQGHDLWVLLLPAGISAPNDRSRHLQEFGADRFIELPPEPPVRRFLRRLPMRLRRKAGHVLKLSDRFYDGLDALYLPEWTGALERLHQRIGFDVAVVEYVFHSAAFAAFAGAHKVLDTHDAFADRHLAYGTPRAGQSFYSLRAEDETRGFCRADTLLAIQQAEGAIFADQIGARPGAPVVTTVSHFNDLTAAPVTDSAAPRAVFLASRNPANAAAAQAFIDHVLPLVMRRVPAFRLVLAGMICEVVKDHPAVIKLGQVPRAIDALARASVSIVPITTGTGINIKLLDAMAAGVPVVSTAFAARGLPCGFREGVLTAPDGDHGAFADALVRVLQDDALRRRMAAAARRTAERWNEAQHAALREVFARAERHRGRRDAA